MDASNCSKFFCSAAIVFAGPVQFKKDTAARAFDDGADQTIRRLRVSILPIHRTAHAGVGAGRVESSSPVCPSWFACRPLATEACRRPRAPDPASARCWRRRRPPVRDRSNSPRIRRCPDRRRPAESSKSPRASAGALQLSRLRARSSAHPPRIPRRSAADAVNIETTKKRSAHIGVEYNYKTASRFFRSARLYAVTAAMT